MRSLVLLAVSGCGRIAFHHLPDDASLADTPRLDIGATSLDASLLQNPCTPAASIPDPLMILGSTVEYPIFGPTPMPVPGVLMRATENPGATVIAETTSDANGDFAIVIPNGGQPRAFVLEASKAGYLTGYRLPDHAFDQERFMGNILITQARVDAVYAAAGVVQNPALATLILVPVECMNNFTIEGVTLGVTPTPEAIIYFDANAAPSLAQTTTVLPTPSAWALNVAPGIARIFATKSGSTFLDFPVAITGGLVINGAVIRPVE